MVSSSPASLVSARAGRAAKSQTWALAAHAAACGVGSAPDPGQALGGDDLGDAGAVERCAFSGERVGDLVDGMPSGP